jgi:uncharacterized protein YdhG (YjbR/CyaY superfamily)
MSWDGLIDPVASACQYCAMSDVDDFLARVSEPAHSALQKLRAQIKAAAPGAEEVINYGVPMFRLGGRNLVSFAAAKTHCSFFVQSPAVMEQFAAKLEGFHTAKGTIRFKPEKPVPAALVKAIVKARIAENAALGKKKG